MLSLDHLFPLVLALALVLGCSGETTKDVAGSSNEAPIAPPSPQTRLPGDEEAVRGDAPGGGTSGEDVANGEVTDNETVIVFLGDSLTAGFGLDEDRAHPALIDGPLREAGYDNLRIVNAGVTGDTTAGGLRRLDWLLRQDPDVLVVSLGGNDALRALPVTEAEENLRQIILGAQAAGAQVLLTGMLAPPNYGPDYAESFAAIFPGLAAELEVPLVPFLLEGVAAVPELNLVDGIHPNAVGQQRVAENVLPYLIEVLDSIQIATEGR